MLQRDPHHLISPQDLKARLDAAKVPLMIDVRRPEAFEAFHLRGAVNIPLHALKTKSFLKDKEIVLITEGYRYRELADTIDDLSERGFARVRLLDGGLNRWRRAGYPLVGDVFAGEAIERLAPAAYARERGVDQWLVLDVSKKAAKGEDAPLAEATRVPFTGTGRGFLRAFDKRLAGHRGAGGPAVLLVDADDTRYRLIRVALADRGEVNVFFLDGGMTAWQGYLDRQAVVRRGGQRVAAAATTQERPCP